jgi:glutathione-specific gamma-glutamylcyclotransferase
MPFKPPRPMRLSARHVDLMRRDIPDPGFQVFPGMRPATDGDYEAMATELAAGAAHDSFWVFAYGSLIWKPEFTFAESRIARAVGWRRIFCLGWDYRFRGSRERPGLMLALDRGGSCTGVAFRLEPDGVKASMDRLVRREMSMVPTAFPPRWITVRTEKGPVRALTFAMNRLSGRYIAGLSDEAVADALAAAQGFRGSMAEYLFSTVSKLEELGIHDRHLWRLQELVAERIEQAHAAASTPA